MSSHNHGGQAGHAGHSHGLNLSRRLGIVPGLIAGIALNLVIVVIQIIAGIIAGSLALISDALHSATDISALAITWFALAQAKKPPSAFKTFGYHRTGILTALVNSLVLVLVTLWIFYEAYQRLLDPQPVGGTLVLIAAIVALAANLLIVYFLHGRAEEDLNIRSAVLHLLGDAAASAAVIVAGLVIIITGWYPADPLVSVLLGLAILWGAWRIIRETLEILLEASPRTVDVDKAVEAMIREEGVLGVHDMHVWTLGSGIYALSCHILIEDIRVSESSRIIRNLKHMLRCDFHITHSTIEVESVSCNVEGPYCQISDHHLIEPCD
ncbi:MAG: cation transporter [Thermoleophilia bacterium]|nr:cation transporter [Thermoleophilia bacterium]